MQLLRFFTAGNVDDGKSTLIGRLLYDSGSISTDILETLTRQSKTIGEHADIDLALLTDGLRAEREQGITIDVAYKYFSTPKRKFIIADTPGHQQYTRNMFTGASNADLAILLVDARHGLTDQTKRHSIISAVLGIPEILVCINKMDLVGYGENVFSDIKSDYETFAKKIGLTSVSFLPVSALTGENVVQTSDRFSWFEGPTLLQFLEEVQVESAQQQESGRFQVQYVIRPQTTELHDYRGYAGTVLSGTLSVGETVKVLPSGLESVISRIEYNSKDVESATVGEPIILHLADNLDISRGNTIAPINEQPQVSQEVQATICWMDNAAFQPGQKLLMQQNSFRSRAVIREITGKVDIHSFERIASDGGLALNDFADVQLKTAVPLSFDAYQTNRKTGAFILINENTNNTVAAGILQA